MDYTVRARPAGRRRAARRVAPSSSGRPYAGGMTTDAIASPTPATRADSPAPDVAAYDQVDVEAEVIRIEQLTDMAEQARAASAALARYGAAVRALSRIRRGALIGLRAAGLNDSQVAACTGLERRRVGQILPRR